MSSPISIPCSSKSISYASAVASSPTTSITMCSPSSSPRSSGVYIPVHKRASGSSPSSPSHTLPYGSQSTHYYPITYTSSFLLSLRPAAQVFNEQIKLRIRESLEPEVADMVLMERRMRNGLQFRTTRKTRGVNPTPTPPKPLPSTSPTTRSIPATKESSQLAPLEFNLLRNSSRRTRSSSARARPPRQMLRLSRNAARVMNTRESWRTSRTSSTPFSMGVPVA